MNHPIVHWQILATDPDRVASFYRSLFEWTIDACNPLGYRRVETGDGVEGGIWPAPPGATNFVQLFVAVPDVAAAARRATELGGSVLVPPQVLPDGDELAILRDCEGMPFGVMREKPSTNAP